MALILYRVSLTRRLPGQLAPSAVWYAVYTRSPLLGVHLANNVLDKQQSDGG